MSRIFAISDIHVDFNQNLQIVQNWSDNQYKNDVLILAGDVTDSLELLKSTLVMLRQKFAKICFVPGNHDVWVRRNRDGNCDSIVKFGQVLQLCQRIDIETKPACIHCIDNSKVWLVPLFSWYTQPEEDTYDSLYFAVDGEKKEMCDVMWSDNYNCVWPDGMLSTVSEYFSELNSDAIKQDYNVPVITYSHFLPRIELIKSSDEDHTAIQAERQLLGLAALDYKSKLTSPKGFNFTRFAGSKVIDKQARKCKAFMHVFGHQHRNRDRNIDGMRYVSHCLGYERERQEGLLWGLNKWEQGPKLIWPVDSE